MGLRTLGHDLSEGWKSVGQAPMTSVDFHARMIFHYGICRISVFGANMELITPELESPLRGKSLSLNRRRLGSSGIKGSSQKQFACRRQTGRGQTGLGKLFEPGTCQKAGLLGGAGGHVRIRNPFQGYLEVEQ